MVKYLHRAVTLRRLDELNSNAYGAPCAVIKLICLSAVVLFSSGIVVMNTFLKKQTLVVSHGKTSTYGRHDQIYLSEDSYKTVPMGFFITKVFRQKYI